MPITLKRRDNESNERLIRRFSRRIQTSGLLLRAKRRQYFEQPKNSNRKKKDALRRLLMRAREDYLRKIGELEEDTYTTRNKRG
ncbi:30S ribosomal protein S21 [bacterium]|jgi:ribosomal protein S21|nr:30S ribosomal protein S21 [bacterium]MDP6571705.1 30S ribosomal protein S21 [Patescibacteria group bacterium]MDP6756072.1 30S ribosomal protein S21 [Patescibacteria group bacterium]|tara:strand:- start:3410 stop:3661 length:252 start_codon:yes stop_codon:yes gene_type:complete